jgi:hypothetical protein
MTAEITFANMTVAYKILCRNYYYKMLFLVFLLKKISQYYGMPFYYRLHK